MVAPSGQSCVLHAYSRKWQRDHENDNPSQRAEPFFLFTEVLQFYVAAIGNNHGWLAIISSYFYNKLKRWKTLITFKMDTWIKKGQGNYNTNAIFNQIYHFFKNRHDNTFHWTFFVNWTWLLTSYFFGSRNDLTALYFRRRRDIEVLQVCKQELAEFLLCLFEFSRQYVPQRGFLLRAKESERQSGHGPKVSSCLIPPRCAICLWISGLLTPFGRSVSAAKVSWTATALVLQSQCGGKKLNTNAFFFFAMTVQEVYIFFR